MKEILSLSYDASTRAVVAVLAHTKESEHVPGTFVRQLGLPDYTERVLIDDVPELQAALDRLVGLVESRAQAKGLASPELIAAHAEIARREERLAKNEAEKREQLAALEAAKRRELDALDEQIASRRAEADKGRP
jgi:hypothetical protein